jgi:hypothetical protein
MQPRMDTLLNAAKVILDALGEGTPVYRVSIDVEDATITVKVEDRYRHYTPEEQGAMRPEGVR